MEAVEKTLSTLSNTKIFLPFLQICVILTSGFIHTKGQFIEDS